MCALLSVLRQTLPAQEIIVVYDTASSQHSLRTLEEITLQGLKEFPPWAEEAIINKIKFVKSGRRGISSARNSGIMIASNPWLAFLDDDDEWLTDKMQRQANIIAESNPPSMQLAKQSSTHSAPKYSICHTSEKWLRNGRHLNQMNKHKPNGGKIYLKSIQLCSISPSSAVIHCGIFNKYGMFDEKMPVCEDFDMWLRITAYEEVLLVEDPLVIKYDGHANQLSHLYWGMDRFRIYALQKMLQDKNLIAKYREATEKSIKQRLSILAEGASKRNKQRHSLYYSAIQSSMQDNQVGKSMRQIYFPAIK